MPPDRTIILGDAHLGAAPSGAARALERFLHCVPEVARHLIVNGDLFEFWFEYRTVIPSAAFPILSALHTLRERGVVLTMIGGNHDRWGGPFWEEHVGAAYHRREVECTLHGLRARIAHGDGLADPAGAPRVLQWLVHHPLTVGTFRWIHPDVGLRLVRSLGKRLPGKRRRAELLARSAQLQDTAARALMAQRRDLALLVLGHTHRPALVTFEGPRWYLNPGAWLDGYRYALIGPNGPELAHWEG